MIHYSIMKADFIADTDTPLKPYNLFSVCADMDVWDTVKAYTKKNIAITEFYKRYNTAHVSLDTDNYIDDVFTVTLYALFAINDDGATKYFICSSNNITIE